MALLQKNAISSSAVLAALCRCLQWPSALRRCRRLEGGIDAALGSCELADAPGQWPQWPVTLLGNGEKEKEDENQVTRWWDASVFAMSVGSNIFWGAIFLMKDHD